jgi:hypothetical protein
MVFDSCAKVFEVTPGTSGAAANSDVLTTGLAGDVRKLQVAPKLVQTMYAALKLRLASLSINGIIKVNRQDVGDWDQLDVTFFARRPVFDRDVFGEFALCRFNLVRKASRGEMPAIVEDNPR